MMKGGDHMRQEKLTEEQINKATEWWGEIIGGTPNFQALSTTERISGNNRGMETCEMMATAFRKDIDPDAIERFKAELHNRLSDPGFSAYHGLGVDYDPCPCLYGAAVAAGIDVCINTFPWKTHMYFEDNKVRVKYGYGAEKKEI